MSNGLGSGVSGTLGTFVPAYETRRIVVAEGLDAREGDFRAKGEEPLFDFLSRTLGSNFNISNGTRAQFRNDQQKVEYIIDLVFSKQAFKEALQTDGIAVLYLGHARYGRGACFDPNAPSENHAFGNFWEQGDSVLNGIFRMGYAYVPVATEDMEHHHYMFAPVGAELNPPPLIERHPDARRSLARITLPEGLRQFVDQNYVSPSNQYWGYIRRNETNILLHAGWINTRSTPFELGSTQLNCKVFCHFGCSSKIHFWKIVRNEDYKNWRRDRPPTNRFAYFTTATSDSRGAYYWLHSLLSYDQENNNQSWWNSLEYAKRTANNLLRAGRVGYQIF